jgi:nucleoside-diphosphate-sugar epimerase
MAEHLSDKVVVVTGGGSGIGKALAIAFAGQGARVSICGRTPKTLEETAAQIRTKSGEVLAVRCDVSDEQTVDSLFTQTVRHFGPIDGIAHCAAQPSGASQWRDVLSSNISGVYNILEAARVHGIKRVAFASTSQVINGYPLDVPITWDMRPRPVNYYAVSKVCGEMLGHMYAEVHGLEVVCIRIGTFYKSAKPPTGFVPVGKYLSIRDCVQLFTRALTAPGIKFEIVFGTSNNARCRFDLHHAREVLDYAPLDTEDETDGSGQPW